MIAVSFNGIASANAQHGKHEFAPLHLLQNHPRHSIWARDGGVTDLTWVEVAEVGDIEEDDAKQVRIGGRCIAIFNIDGTHYATADICTHAHAFLSEGYIQDGKVECPLHQGVFSIKTGKALNPPVTKDIETFPTKTEGNRILVAIPGGTA